MNKGTIILVVGVLSTATGCLEDKDKQASEVVQTVEWYMAHDKERTEVMAKCDNEPGTLGGTPTCINASRAASKKVWSSEGGAIKVAPLTFK